MEKEIQTVGVVGLGALGLLFGSRIQSAVGSENIGFVMDDARFLRHESDRYTVNGTPVSFRLLRAAEAKPVDLAIVAVKYPALPSALNTMKGLVGQDTVIISVMNGISTEGIIREHYPGATIIPCVPVGMDAMRDGAAMTYVNEGWLQIGVTEERDRAALLRLAAFFRKTGVKHKVEDDVMHGMWWKFMANVGMNQASTVYDSTYSEVMNTPEKRASFERAMREVMALSEAEGINLTEDDFQAAVDLMNGADAASYPSMHQDFAAGRKTEVELFAGTVRRLAAKHGISVPENDFYYERILELEKREALE